MLRPRNKTTFWAMVIAVPAVVSLVLGLLVLTAPLPAPDVPETTEIRDISGRVAAKLFTQNRIEVPVAEMPRHLLNAVVAVEDDRFYQHSGIDFIGIARAMYRNARAGRVLEGGSTLTQQLARNLYLTQERTLVRKVREAVLTLKLESSYSKQEILGMYLNTIYLGKGAYGVEVAAQTYFGKSARRLTLAEAALIAGLPQAPEGYAPSSNPEAAIARRNVVLQKMAEQGYVREDQAAAARSEPLALAPPPPPASEAPYFVDYVTAELHDRFPDLATNLHRGGYQIHTTIDLDLQRQANKAIAEMLSPGEDKDPVGAAQAALVALDPHSGQIRALVGGREPTVQRNRAREPHQPGSAFKPFVYAAALETYSYTPASTQLDAPAEFPGATPDAPWRPRNFQDKYTNQPATMRDALRKSLNVVTAQWMSTLKPVPVITLARRMGIESPLAENLTLGLGSSEVTPLELTRAYASLANGGFAVKPLAVLRVTDRKGNVLAEQHVQRSRALDPGVAFIMTDMLKEVLRPGGTAAHVAGYLGGRPAAGKTGTSDESRDAWFVGYSPELVTSVWVGSDDRRRSDRTGGTAAAPIWARFMGGALRNRPARDWTPPSNVVVQEICALTGLLPNASCPVKREWFLKGTVPTRVDSAVHWDQLPELPGVPWAPPEASPGAVPGEGPAGPAPELGWPPVTPPGPLLPNIPWPALPSLPVPPILTPIQPVP